MTNYEGLYQICRKQYVAKFAHHQGGHPTYGKHSGTNFRITKRQKTRKTTSRVVHNTCDEVPEELVE